MAISYRSIRSDRQWRASTGLSESEFNKLSSLFAQTYEEFHDQSLEEFVAAQNDKPVFTTIDEFLFSFSTV